MIRSRTVQQITSYTPVAHELTKTLEVLQEHGGRVLNIYETKVNKAPGISDQGFIIIYDDGKKPEDSKKDAIRLCDTCVKFPCIFTSDDRTECYYYVKEPEPYKEDTNDNN